MKVAGVHTGEYRPVILCSFFSASRLPAMVFSRAWLRRISRCLGPNLGPQMEKRRCHWRFDGQITSGLGVTMGQSKAKRKSQAALLASRPGCIYCAGAAIATTIEHMPPISLFEGRQRPKGLEFPACEACNNGTGHSDLVAAMLARTWPDAKSVSMDRH